VSGERDDEWWDDAAGPVVRPFVVTGGRTHSARLRFDIATQVAAAGAHSDRMGLEPEHIAILELCKRPQSIAELAAYVNVPLMVIKVLVGDLVERGDVMIDAQTPIAEAPGLDVLQAVLDGIRAL
jgi:Protein of unknown function (DUF742)